MTPGSAFWYACIGFGFLAGLLLLWIAAVELTLSLWRDHLREMGQLPRQEPTHEPFGAQWGHW
jgi:hypothetical protein